MIKRSLIAILFLCGMAKAYSQQTSYTFPTPKGWHVEKIAFPIDFAPKIPFTGTEELRFTPGWGNSKTGEYWAYAFLWFVEGEQSLKKDALQSYLTQYFNGLYLSNLKNKANAPANFTKADIKKARPGLNDEQAFDGKITTLDFLTGQAITFYTRIHIRNYKITGHSAILVEISPQDYQNVVWDKLDGVVNGFEINK